MCHPTLSSDPLIRVLERERESRAVGRAHVGGPFNMTTHKGEPFSEKNLLGQWSLIYFGFTNCPDICPEELDKMSDAVRELGELLCLVDVVPHSHSRLQRSAPAFPYRHV